MSRAQTAPCPEDCPRCVLADEKAAEANAWAKANGLTAAEAMPLSVLRWSARVAAHLPTPSAPEDQQ